MSVDRLLELVDGSSAKRMFGGQGVYAEGVMFALESSHGDLYLKVDDESRADFEELGAGPFAPMPGRVMRSFYELPDEIASDDAELAAWAHRAIEAARKKS